MYAHFLSSFHHFQKAFIYWDECVKKFEVQMSVGERIEIFNNLATASLHLENFDDSIELYEKSLMLVRNQYESNPTNKNLFDLSYVLNNYGLLLTNMDENEKSEKLLIESHKNREKLVELDKKKFCEYQ